jgi:hypothetical protein
LILAAVAVLACQLGAPRGVPRATPTPRGRLPTAAAATQVAPTAAAPADTPTARQPFAVNSAGLSFAAPANPNGQVALDENNLPFLLLFPDLRTAPAPDWLQTGTRVTYRVESATIPQAQGQTGAAGAGYAQYDVVALEPGLVVATSKLYLDATEGGGELPSLVSPVLGLPGIGEFWLNPRALANAEQVATAELAVTRTDKTIGGTVYHGVYFEYKHDTTRDVWLYDDTTGLLLFSSYAIGGDNDPTRQLGQITLAGQRQLDLPWHAGRVPGWVAQTHHLHYTGTFETHIAGAPAPGIAAQADVSLQDHFAHWSAYRLSGGVQGAPPTPVLRLTGGDQIFDGLWLAPEALAVLQDGQTRDTDPITGATITVTRDSRTVVLAETGQRYQATMAYGVKDGRLVESVLQEQIGVATNVTQVDLSGSD